MAEHEGIIHIFASKHRLLEEKEAEALLSRFNISKRQMPRIKKNDAAIEHLNPKAGDIVLITRKSPVGAEAPFYRVVTED